RDSSPKNKNTVIIYSPSCCSRLSFVDHKRRLARGRTRVNIGAAFQRWRELKEREGLESDAEVALFLLDR
uniref:Uncharacterized protein n=1 Tax=Sinocyclocheilus rhinocerous TaxID=307959 RepID=A0A673GNR2_9TELE